jgi:serine/threonine protein kinase
MRIAMPARHADNDVDKRLIEIFTQRIQERICDWYGSSSSLVSAAPEIKAYTNSFLLRYVLQTSTGARSVLLKIRRNPKMDSLTSAIQARELHSNIPQEFDALRHVYKRIGSGHEHFAAIRPLDYFEDYFAIVMEEFPSHSLRHLLQRQRTAGRWRNAAASLPVVAQRAGKLLRFFHERVYSTEQYPYSADDVLAAAQTYASRIQQYSWGDIQAGVILDRLAQQLSGKDIRSIPFTSAHQDLTCNNVLYSDDGRVCLSDIKVKSAPIYSDLGLLLIHPETFRNQIFLNGKYFSQQYLKSYRDAILQGYSAGSPLDDFLVHIYSAIRVLDKWAMHQELFYRYKGLKRVITRPLLPLITSYFQRLWNNHMQMAVDHIRHP